MWIYENIKAVIFRVFIPVWVASIKSICFNDIKPIILKKNLRLYFCWKDLIFTYAASTKVCCSISSLKSRYKALCCPLFCARFNAYLCSNQFLSHDFVPAFCCLYFPAEKILLKDQVFVFKKTSKSELLCT